MVDEFAYWPLHARLNLFLAEKTTIHCSVIFLTDVFRIESYKDFADD